MRTSASFTDVSWNVGLASEKSGSHDTNEDSLMFDWLAPGRRLLLIAVADGMGGLESGRDASDAAISSLRNAFTEGEPAKDSLIKGFRDAHSRIRELSEKGKASKRMGTTLVAALLSDRQLLVANVGDSRAYLVQISSAVQLTSDHSAVGEQVSRGLLSKDEASRSPYRHLLTRCLGAEVEAPEVDVFEFGPLEKGESLLLCSDGLHSVLNEREMAGILRVLEPEAAAKKLIDLAQDRGAPDDASAIVVGVGHDAHARSDDETPP